MKFRIKYIVIGVLAFNLALLLLTQGLSYQAEMQNPRAGILVDVDNTEMHVIQHSEGNSALVTDSPYDAIVLIHGASTSALDFSTNLLPELSKRHHTIAIDRPGHGYSERSSRADMDNPINQAELILDTLSQMQIEKPVLIGHSWAGSLVMAALLADHESVSPAGGVVIAGVTHPYEREDSAPTRMALAPVSGVFFRWQYLAPIGRFAIAPTVERFFAPDAVPENYIQDTGLNLSLRPRTYLYNAKDRSNLPSNIVFQSELYGNVDTPMLSIAASEDRVVPPADHHEKLIKEVKDIEAVTIEGAGHSPHQTRLEEVTDAIEAFLGRL